jgi:hypothetical protein
MGKRKEAFIHSRLSVAIASSCLNLSWAFKMSSKKAFFGEYYYGRSIT